MTGTPIELSNSLADLRERLKIEHAAIGMALKDCVAHAMAAGDILIEAKRQVGHGQWLPWLESCGLSERTAQRYMRIARHRFAIEANPTSVSDLGVSGALALLAVPRQAPAESMTHEFADLVEISADALFDFEEIDSKEDKKQRLKQRALLDEARATVEKVGEILDAIGPELAEIIDSESGEFCQRIIDQTGQFLAVMIAAMGARESDYEALAAGIRELEAEGLDARSISDAISGEFDFDAVPRPIDSTALVRNLRDTANDWLRWLEQRAEVRS